MRTRIITVLTSAAASALAAAVIVVTFADSPPAGIATQADRSRLAASPTPEREQTVGCTAASRTTDAGAAEARSGKPTSERYLVRAGDTLWGIADRLYDDPAQAMGRIKRRNGLRRDMLLAGEVLVLPAEGRRGEGPLEGEGCVVDQAVTDGAPPER